MIPKNSAHPGKASAAGSATPGNVQPLLRPPTDPCGDSLPGSHHAASNPNLWDGFTHPSTPSARKPRRRGSGGGLEFLWTGIINADVKWNSGRKDGWKPSHGSDGFGRSWKAEKLQEKPPVLGLGRNKGWRSIRRLILAPGTETWDLEEWEFPSGGVWTSLMAVGGAIGPSHEAAGNSCVR